jgi:rubrerythrin
MFSKDPSELVRKEKFDNEEISRSIRLALAAELDAINFYLQQSRLMPEGPFKKVHEDIAKEEVTHFGEFLRLLHEYEPHDFDRIDAGWNEASGLLGSHPAFLKMDSNKRNISPDSEKEKTSGEYLKECLRTIRWDESGVLLPGNKDTIAPFEKISMEFKLEKGMKEIYRNLLIRKQEDEYRSIIEKYIYEDSKISLTNRSTTIRSEKSDASGIISSVLKALKILSDHNFDSDLETQVSFSVYEILMTVMNGNENLYKSVCRILHRIRLNPNLSGKKLIVFRKDMFTVAVKKAPELHKISEDVDSINYGIYGWILPLLLDENASVLIEFK